MTELQNGTVDGIDDIDPAGVATVTDDVSLQVGATRRAWTSSTSGFNTADKPFDNEGVRRAIATGLDRASIVANDFPPGAEVAQQYTPCAVPHGCAGGAWYDYDPTLAKETLAAAGFPNGFATTIHYSATPSAVAPRPRHGVATEIQSELLTNLGIQATLVAVPDDAYRAGVDAGTLDGIHLFDRGGTYPDASAYLDPRFGGGRLARVRAAVRRHRQGPRRRPRHRRSAPSATRPTPRSTT